VETAQSTVIAPRERPASRNGGYGRRNHALYDGEALVAVTAYKRGAVEVKRRFETLEQEIARLKQVLSEVGGEPPGEARRAGAMERLQAEREAGNMRER
jgi:hypothetical protein